MGKYGGQGGRMIKLATAAQRLGVSDSTLRRWLKGGRVRGIRLGKQLFFSEEELQRMEQQGVELTSPGGKQDGES